MIDILDGIDLPCIETELSVHAGVSVFTLSVPDATAAVSPIHVIGADAGGFRLAFKHVEGRATLAAMIARHVGDEPLYHGDARESVLGEFGILDSNKVAGTVRTGGLAIDLARRIVHANHRLFDHPRPQLVAAVQARLLAAGLDRIVDLIGPHRVAVQEACSILYRGEDCSRLRMEAGHAEGLHGALLAYPALSEALATSSHHYPLSDDPYRVALSYLSFARVPEPVARELLRQASLGGGPALVESHLLAVLRVIPRDWMPGSADAAGWNALSSLLDTFTYATRRTGVDLVDLIQGAKGRWAAYVRTLARAADVTDPAPSAGIALGVPISNLGHAASDLMDLTDDFRDTLIRPVLSFARGVEVRADDDEARSLAHAVLYRNRGLARILALSRSWHLASGVALPSASGGARSRSWAPVLPAWESGGIRIVPLATRGELIQEGAPGNDAEGRPGLHHCVGTHWKACMEGRARVMGVRRIADGERLSTFEVSFARKPIAVSEHKGLRNADPSPGCKATVAAYMAGIEDGSIPFDDAPIVESRRRNGKVALADACGYDWADEDRVREAIVAWGAYLAKPLRGTAPRTFLARSAALAIPSGPRP